MAKIEIHKEMAKIVKKALSQAANEQPLEMSATLTDNLAKLVVALTGGGKLRSDLLASVVDDEVAKSKIFQGIFKAQQIAARFEEPEASIFATMRNPYL